MVAYPRSKQLVLEPQREAVETLFSQKGRKALEHFPKLYHSAENKLPSNKVSLR